MTGKYLAKAAMTIILAAAMTFVITKAIELGPVSPVYVAMIMATGLAIFIVCFVKNILGNHIPVRDAVWMATLLFVIVFFAQICAMLPVFTVRAVFIITSLLVIVKAWGIDSILGIGFRGGDKTK